MSGNQEWVLHIISFEDIRLDKFKLPIISQHSFDIHATIQLFLELYHKGKCKPLPRVYSSQ